MKNDKKYGLIGSLYYELLNADCLPESINTTETFTAYLGGDHNSKTTKKNYNTDWSQICRNDDFGKHREYFKNVSTFLNSIDEFAKDTKIVFKNYINRAFEVLKVINKILEEHEPTENKEPYNIINSIINETVNSGVSSLDSLVFNLRIFFLYAVFKSIPHNILVNHKYTVFLKEYEENYICMYGVVKDENSVAGIALRNLYKKGNIFAENEMGDRNYYNGHYSNALEDYKRAAGINDFAGIDTDHCHPLALYNYAYIVANYQRAGKLKYTDIYELNQYSESQRIRIAVDILKSSRELSICPNCENLLGNISKSLSPVERKSLGLNSPITYYEIAASQGFVYAYNNLAIIKIEEAISHEKDTQDGENYMEDAINNMEKAASLGEPWALNTLGRFYHDGIMYIQGLEEACFPKYINHQRSKEMLTNALDTITDINTEWAAANLLVFFYDQLIEEGAQGLIDYATYIVRNTKNAKVYKYALINCPDVQKTLINYSNINTANTEILEFLKSLDLPEDIKNYINDEYKWKKVEEDMLEGTKEFLATLQ